MSERVNLVAMRQQAHDWIDEWPQESDLWYMMHAVVSLIEHTQDIEDVLERFVDRDSCWYYQSSFCQTHLSSAPCRVAEARALLGLGKE
jgi:hypothetical protein